MRTANGATIENFDMMLSDLRDREKFTWRGPQLKVFRPQQVILNSKVIKFREGSAQGLALAVLISQEFFGSRPLTDGGRLPLCTKLLF